MYSYLQNVKTNVSNAKRNRPKVIKSLKSKWFFIGITPILLEWGQHTLQRDCPCIHHIIINSFIQSAFLLFKFSPVWITFTDCQLCMCLGNFWSFPAIPLNIKNPWKHWIFKGFNTLLIIFLIIVCWTANAVNTPFSSFLSVTC